MGHLNRWTRVVWVTVLLVGLLATAALAESLEESLFVTGFVSQGYLNTWNNNYLVPRSVNGTAEFTEAAITIVAQPEDKFRVGIQLLARNFGDMGNGFVSVDWAYGDYRWRDWFGVRLGKVKMPFGFYNEGRDVDMLRTSIFLPQSIYNETMRDFILAYEGIGGYGNFSLGCFGDGDFHLFGGTLNVPDPTQGFWGQFYNAEGEAMEGFVGEVLAEAEGDPATARFTGASGQVVSFPWIYGGALNWNTPIEGLRLGVSGMQGRFNFQGDMHYDVFVNRGDSDVADYLPFTLSVDETTEIGHIAVVGAEFLQNHWSFVTEYYHEKMGRNAADGWYAQADWQVGQRCALGAYFNESRINESDVRELGLPDYYAWQNDLVLSLRIDLTEHWLLKIEHHTIDGVSRARRRTMEEELNDPLEQRWGLFAAKTTFHF